MAKKKELHSAEGKEKEHSKLKRDMTAAPINLEVTLQAKSNSQTDILHSNTSGTTRKGSSLLIARYFIKTFIECVALIVNLQRKRKRISTHEYHKKSSL